jgi:HSP20 family protein
MSTIIRWEPFTGVTLRDAMNKLFEESVVRPTNWLFDGQTGAAGFATDLYETPNEVVMKCVLPGVQPENLDISITGDVLTITAEAKPVEVEHKDTYWHTQERRYGTFTRSFTLPTQVLSDQIEATFEHGILTLTMPKAEEVKPKTIKVKTVAKK